MATAVHHLEDEEKAKSVANRTPSYFVWSNFPLQQTETNPHSISVSVVATVQLEGWTISRTSQSLESLLLMSDSWSLVTEEGGIQLSMV